MLRRTFIISHDFRRRDLYFQIPYFAIAKSALRIPPAVITLSLSVERWAGESFRRHTLKDP